MLFVDFESFTNEMKPASGDFRRRLPADVPVFWTITDNIDHDVPFPDKEDGYYAGTDRIFVKPDTDAGLDTALDIMGQKIIPIMNDLGIREVFVGGATYYGCVLGACNDLKAAGIRTYIVHDLTDYYDLPASDHEEAAADFTKARIPVVTRAQALAAMGRTGPSFDPIP